MKDSIRILVSLLLCLGSFQHSGAVTIPATEDTTGYQNRITVSSGVSSLLMVDATHVGFVYFNLDELPTGATVKSARLRMYTSHVRSKGNGLCLHLVQSVWNEAVQGEQPRFNPVPFAEIGPDSIGSRRFVTADVTAQVRDWVSFKTLNEGFAITAKVLATSQQPAGTVPASVFIAAKEGNSIGLPALLDIELQTAGDGSGSTSGVPLPLLDLVSSGTFKLQNITQLPEPLLTFLSPSIRVQPVLPSGGGSLSVSAQGVGTLSYQWLRNGVAIAGGTASELPPSNLQAGTYTVEVRNGFSTTTSGTVTVSGPNFPVQDFVRVSTGTLPSSSALGPVNVSSFYIAKTEVTLAEWRQIRTWAASNGYTDLGDKGGGGGDKFPVTGVNWYDALKWCNARSQLDGRTPVYQSNNAIYKTGQVVPSVDSLANGYRLPTEAEWEFAARGGVQTKGHLYSGSGDLSSVGWYTSNANYASQAVGGKLANELGLFDMSGNVWEWCFSLFKAPSTDRVNRGGSWFTNQDGCTVAFRKEQSPDSRLNYIGFRVVFSQTP